MIAASRGGRAGVGRGARALLNRHNALAYLLITSGTAMIALANDLFLIPNRPGPDRQ